MKKCKNCKQSFQPYNSLQKFCFEPECTKVMIAEAKKKQWAKTKKEFKENDVEVWKKLCQTICHKYIRLRDWDKGCISCGKPAKEKNFDAGHMWSSGGHSNVRYNEHNINGQCSRPCNKDLAGDINNYRLNFVKRYSQEILDNLDSISKAERRYTIDDYKEIISYYKEKIRNFKK